MWMKYDKWELLDLSLIINIIFIFLAHHNNIFKFHCSHENLSILKFHRNHLRLLTISKANSTGILKKAWNPATAIYNKFDKAFSSLSLISFMAKIISCQFISFITNLLNLLISSWGYISAFLFISSQKICLFIAMSATFETYSLLANSDIDFHSHIPHLQYIPYSWSKNYFRLAGG